MAAPFAPQPAGDPFAEMSADTEPMEAQFLFSLGPIIVVKDRLDSKQKDELFAMFKARFPAAKKQETIDAYKAWVEEQGDDELKVGGENETFCCLNAI